MLISIYFDKATVSRKKKKINFLSSFNNVLFFKKFNGKNIYCVAEITLIKLPLMENNNEKFINNLNHSIVNENKI